MATRLLHSPANTCFFVMARKLASAWMDLPLQTSITWPNENRSVRWRVQMASVPSIAHN
ncbi:hypothetical protein SLEP1_g42510 [Rubroshorea leprosula]|uniref:Uncharacterized protein n=1 Tax=Rubroshorea leprosula TaxID=152421 RepID=A0AAV5LAZ3_9ROSI|nr:hypothetical protein SLEP1_g42510 [Rubroshorea leprosula]